VAVRAGAGALVRLLAIYREATGIERPNHAHMAMKRGPLHARLKRMSALHRWSNLAVLLPFAGFLAGVLLLRQKLAAENRAQTRKIVL
jgi:hypothetical protein